MHGPTHPKGQEGKCSGVSGRQREPAITSLNNREAELRAVSHDEVCWPSKAVILELPSHLYPPRLLEACKIQGIKATGWLSHLPLAQETKGSDQEGTATTQQQVQDGLHSWSRVKFRARSLCTVTVHNFSRASVEHLSLHNRVLGGFLKCKQQNEPVSRCVNYPARWNYLMLTILILENPVLGGDYN